MGDQSPCAASHVQHSAIRPKARHALGDPLELGVHTGRDRLGDLIDDLARKVGRLRAPSLLHMCYVSMDGANSGLDRAAVGSNARRAGDQITTGTTRTAMQEAALPDQHQASCV